MVSPAVVGGMEEIVVFFDMDHKIQLSHLLQCIMEKLAPISDLHYREALYNESVSRVVVFQPVDVIHFSLLISSLALDTSSKRALQIT